MTNTCELVGPELPGRYKWYGGVLGKQDNAIYAIPHNSPHVLRITPSSITLHGDYSVGCHKWHGAAAAPNGDIVSVPANADTVLIIRPGDPEPQLFELGDASCIRTGRHRTDRKYKYLGSLTGTDGCVYCFPSGSERVLQIDTEKQQVKEVGPNLYDEQMERLCQNKWQNGLVVEPFVYAIPLAAESVLRIDCSQSPPVFTTWPLPAPFKGLAKWEGGIVAPNGVIYAVPNNHKAILRIETSSPKETKAEPKEEEKKIGEEDLPYRSGIATLRSSVHRVKSNPKNRQTNPKTKIHVWLPPPLLQEDIFSFDSTKYDLVNAVAAMLRQCDPAIVGAFRDESSRLEDFVIPVESTWRTVNGGNIEAAQRYMSETIEQDETFLEKFDKLVTETVLPYLKRRLVSANAASDDEPTTFYYQRPPTLRLQPGPARAKVQTHNDAIYGHQHGELNFWMPLTDRSLTGVDLWAETAMEAGDFHPLCVKSGEIVAFHGSSCKHYINKNTSMYTRMSMDFRVGVKGFFDPTWMMQGTTDDHGRREVSV
jgi:hypothetical protein